MPLAGSPVEVTGNQDRTLSVAFTTGTCRRGADGPPLMTPISHVQHPTAFSGFLNFIPIISPFKEDQATETIIPSFK